MASYVQLHTEICISRQRLKISHFLFQYFCVLIRFVLHFIHVEHTLECNLLLFGDERKLLMNIVLYGRTSSASCFVHTMKVVSISWFDSRAVQQQVVYSNNSQTSCLSYN